MNSLLRSSTTLPSNTSITEKRSVISSSSSSLSGLGGGGDEDGGIYYRSSITPRQSALLNRTSSSTIPISPGRRTTVEISSTTSFLPSSNSTNTGVTTFKSSREREKKDLQDLNERFANYIEKVRFLEAQNKKLAGELDQLRSKWGTETSAVKQMYETELTEARKLIDETNKEKSRLQLRVGQLEEQLDDYQRQLDEAKKWRSQDRDTINKLNQQLSELEGEIRMLRRSNEAMETERVRDKGTIAKLQEELEKLRIDLSNETIARLDAENKYQTLVEEIQFLKDLHEQELKELSALAYRDTTAENREFWKNELSQAIRDMQQEYDLKVDQIRGEMESFYNLKVQEFRTGATKQNMEVAHSREETKKLQKMLSDSRGRMSDLEARNALLEKQYQDLMRELEMKEHDHDQETNSLREEMNKLRADMEGMLVELQTLMDAKLSLELEIAAYRKLLESEETRIPIHPSVWNPYSRNRNNPTDSLNKAAPRSSSSKRSPSPHSTAHSTTIQSSSPKRQIPRTSSRPPHTPSSPTVKATATLIESSMRDMEPPPPKTQIVYDADDDDDDNIDDDGDDDEDVDVVMRRSKPGEEGTVCGGEDDVDERMVSDETNSTVDVVDNSNTINNDNNNFVDEKMVASQSKVVHCEPRRISSSDIEPVELEIKAAEVSQNNESVPQKPTQVEANNGKKDKADVTENLTWNDFQNSVDDIDSKDISNTDNNTKNDNVESGDVNNDNGNGDDDDGDDVEDDDDVDDSIGITPQVLEQEMMDRVNEDAGEALAYETINESTSGTTKQNDVVETKQEGDIKDERQKMDEEDKQQNKDEGADCDDKNVPENKESKDENSFTISVVEDVMTVETVSTNESSLKQQSAKSLESKEEKEEEILNNENHTVEGKNESKLDYETVKSAEKENVVIIERKPEGDAEEILKKEEGKSSEESDVNDATEKIKSQGNVFESQNKEEASKTDDRTTSDMIESKTPSANNNTKSEEEDITGNSVDDIDDVEIAKQVVQSVIDESVSETRVTETNKSALNSSNDTKRHTESTITPQVETKSETIMTHELKLQTEQVITSGVEPRTENKTSELTSQNIEASENEKASSTIVKVSPAEEVVIVEKLTMSSEGDVEKNGFETSAKIEMGKTIYQAESNEHVKEFTIQSVNSNLEDQSGNANDVHPSPQTQDHEKDVGCEKSEIVDTPQTGGMNTTEAKMKTEVVIAPENKIETEEATTPEIKPQTEAVITPETKPQSEAVITPETKPQTEVVITPETKSQTETIITPETKSQTEAVITPETKPQREAVITPETKLQTETVITPETKLQTETVITPETKLQTETVITPETKPQTETVIVPETKPQTEAVIIPETKPQSETVITPENKPEIEAVITPETKSQSEAVIITEIKSQTEVIMSPEIKYQNEEAIAPENEPTSEGAISHDINYENDAIITPEIKSQTEAVTPEVRPATAQFVCDEKPAENSNGVKVETKVVTSDTKITKNSDITETTQNTQLDKDTEVGKKVSDTQKTDKVVTEVEEEEHLLGDGACEDLAETSSREPSLVEPSKSGMAIAETGEVKKTVRTDDTDDDGLDEIDEDKDNVEGAMLGNGNAKNEYSQNYTNGSLDQVVSSISTSTSEKTVVTKEVKTSSVSSNEEKFVIEELKVSQKIEQVEIKAEEIKQASENEQMEVKGNLMDQQIKKTNVMESVTVTENNTFQNNEYVENNALQIDQTKIVDNSATSLEELPTTGKIPDKKSSKSESESKVVGYTEDSMEEVENKNQQEEIHETKSVPEKTHSNTDNQSVIVVEEKFSINNDDKSPSSFHDNIDSTTPVTTNDNKTEADSEHVKDIHSEDKIEITTTQNTSVKESGTEEDIIIKELKLSDKTEKVVMKAEDIKLTIEKEHGNETPTQSLKSTTHDTVEMKQESGNISKINEKEGTIEKDEKKGNSEIIVHKEIRTATTTISGQSTSVSSYSSSLSLSSDPKLEYKDKINSTVYKTESRTEKNITLNDVKIADDVAVESNVVEEKIVARNGDVVKVVERVETGQTK